MFGNATKHICSGSHLIRNRSVIKRTNHIDFGTSRIPPNFWKDKNNQLKFMEYASQKLNIKDLSEWYNVTKRVTIHIAFCNIQDLIQIGGYFLRDGEHSFSTLLSQLHPDYNFLPWKFTSTTHNFWDNMMNQRQFMNWAEKELKIKEKSDWYKVTRKVLNKEKKSVCLVFKDFYDLGGLWLLSKYRGSPSALISAVYPEYNWLPWKFDKIQSKYWEDINNQKKFMDWVGNELKIKEMSDWYNVSYRVKYVLLLW